MWTSFCYFTCRAQAFPKALLFITILIAAGVSAQEEKTSSNYNEALKALYSAKQSLISRQQQKHSLKGISYDIELFDTEGNETHLRFESSNQNENKRTVISTSGQSLAKVRMPTPTFLTPEIIDALELKYYKEEQQYWVFRGDMNVYTSPRANKNSNGTDLGNESFDEFLFAFVRIDKSSKQFRNLKFANTQAFHPSNLAKIKNFMIDAWYEPIVLNGALVAIDTKLEISGTYGFVYTFTEGIQQHIKNIHNDEIEDPL